MPDLNTTSLHPEILSSTTPHVVLSASMIHSWLTCERQALYHYILKLPKPSTYLAQETPPTTVGILGHAAIEFWASGIWQGHHPAPTAISQAHALGVMTTWLLTQWYYATCLEVFEVATYESSPQVPMQSSKSLDALSILRTHYHTLKTLPSTGQTTPTLMTMLTESIPPERHADWHTMLQSATTPTLQRLLQQVMPLQNSPSSLTDDTREVLDSTVSQGAKSDTVDTVLPHLNIDYLASYLNLHTPQQPMDEKACPWETKFWEGVSQLGALPAWQRQEEIASLLRIFFGCGVPYHALPLGASPAQLRGEHWVETLFPEWQRTHPETGEPYKIGFRGQIDLLFYPATTTESTLYELFEFKFRGNLFKTKPELNHKKLLASLQVVKDPDASAEDSSDSRQMRYGLTSHESTLYQLPLYAYALETRYGKLPQQAHLMVFRETRKGTLLPLESENTRFEKTLTPLLHTFQQEQEEKATLETTVVSLHQEVLRQERTSFLEAVYQEVIIPMMSPQQTFKPRPHKQTCLKCDYRSVCDAFHQHLA